MLKVFCFSYNAPVRLKSACYIHTSFTSNGQANVMKKFLGGSSKKKRYYNDTPILPSAESFSKGAVEGKKSTNSKRVNVLNKLFMRHITDLMATGENARQFAGFGIEINRVKVTEDFKLVQVFWGAKGTESDDVIGSLLSKNAGKIRHQLTELRVIGMVPKIMFCKDKQLAQLIEIEKNLEKADFGDDYIRPDPVAKLKTQLELNISLDPRIKEKILKADSVIDIEEHEEAIPPMPQDIFGLNHSLIMAKLVKVLKKVELKQKPNPERPIPTLENIESIKFEEGVSKKEELKKFLLKRHLLKSKARKENKNVSPDLEYLKSEMEERSYQKLPDTIFENEDGDFIYEDDVR